MNESVFSHLPLLRFDGRVDAPVLVLANSLGTSTQLWDAQVAALAPSFRIVRFDYPGHGGSPAWAAASVVDIARELLRQLDRSGIGRFRVCGVSLGGAVALEAAALAPDQVDALLVSNTALRFGSEEFWNARMDQARTGGLASISEATLSRWTMPATPESERTRLRRMLESTSLDGYLQCAAMVRDHDGEKSVGRVQAPITVVAGTHDLATPLEHGRAIVQALPHATLVEMPSAHLACIDCPSAFSELLAQWAHSSPISKDN